MWHFLIIGFLFAHGLVHLVMWVWVPKPKEGAEAPFDAGYSWLLGNQKAMAMMTALTAATILIVAGVGLWTNAEWWRSVAVIGLTISFGLMVLYFNPLFLFIEAVNAALIIGLLWLTWPSRTMVGA